MTEIRIPRITRPISLADYAPEYVDEQSQPVTFWVWVNPPRALIAEWGSIGLGFKELIEEGQQSPTDDPALLEERGRRLMALHDRIGAWFAQIWSQKPEAGTWTPDEVKQLMSHLGDADPAVWQFLRDRTHQAIMDHREGRRKN